MVIVLYTNATLAVQIYSIHYPLSSLLVLYIFFSLPFQPIRVSIVTHKKRPFAL